MEKLKDFLYDISDILLALFIIAIMATVISWKFAGSFEVSANIPANHENLSSFQQIETEPEQTEPIVNENPSEEPEPEPEIEPETEPETEKPVVYTTVKIPSGSTGVRIAGILKDSGIIDSTTDFINRTEARGLSSKLQSGSFKIGSDMDLDEIINILTGQ
ncbi:MAG TPA: hypothetical protein VJ990_05230 [Clostridia bacterium]|nr:hypothetical protein [Clostridia bacterium]